MKTILLAMLLTGCGAEAYQTPTALAPKAAQTEPTPQTVDQPETRRDVQAPAAAQAQPNVAASARPALAVAGMADLPLCNVNDEGWIIYVQAEKSLLACLGGDWQAVDVRGAVGVKGDTGAQGEAGKDGVAGAKGDTGAKGDAGERGVQGIVGAKGEPGKTDFPGVGDEWINPDGGERWLIVATAVSRADAVCPSGMTLPADAYTQKFLDHFSVYLSTVPDGFWGQSVNHFINARSVDDAADTGKHLLICTGS